MPTLTTVAKPRNLRADVANHGALLAGSLPTGSPSCDELLRRGARPAQPRWLKRTSRWPLTMTERQAVE
jgi:hypothetical protein